MSSIVPFLYSSSSSTITSWDELLKNKTFKCLEVPSFECLDFVGLEVVEFSSLNVVQQVNAARAGGVDSNNINGLINEFRRGYRSDKLPPILVIHSSGTKKDMWDGYNRCCAAVSLGVSSFPFLVYELKSEWQEKMEDAYDIVSLGANNHAQSKPATIQDFVLRGVNWVSRNGNDKTKDEILAWINSIDHSFNVSQVETISKRIYQETTIAVNITPYPHPRTAQAWVGNYIDTQSSTNPVVVCCKEYGYVERAFLQVMKNYIGYNTEPDGSIKLVPEKEIDNTEIVLYTKGCETAEQVVSQREFAIKYINQLDDLVMQYAVKKLKNLKKAYQITGALPQLNGIEDLDELVNLSDS